MNNTKAKLIIAGLGALLFVFVLYSITGNSLESSFSRQASSTAVAEHPLGEATPMPAVEDIIDASPVYHPPVVNTVPEQTKYENTKYHYSLLYYYDYPTSVDKKDEMEKGSVNESCSVIVAIGKYGFVTIDYVGDITVTTDANDRMKQIQAIAETKRIERVSAKPDSIHNFTRIVGDIEKTVFAGVEGYGFSVREQGEWVGLEPEDPVVIIDRLIPHILIEHKGKVMMITYLVTKGGEDAVLESFKFTK